jgi:excisionase family DNA binding protein
MTNAAILPVSEVVGILGVSRASAYEWINAGIIPSFRVGRRVYVKRAELDRWLAGGEGNAARFVSHPAVSATRAGA